jgi:hypothetical protein
MSTLEHTEFENHRTIERLGKQVEGQQMALQKVASKFEFGDCP